MDDMAGEKEGHQTNGRSREPKRKYMEMLQKVADRQLNQVTIELDDLENVGFRTAFACA